MSYPLFYNCVLEGGWRRPEKKRYNAEEYEACNYRQEGFVYARGLPARFK